MSKHPHAIWVVGSAASGKSTIAEKAFESPKYTLIDVDKPFERLISKYGLSPIITSDTEEEKAKRKEKAQLIKEGVLPPAPKMIDYKNPELYLRHDGNPPTTNRCSVVSREIIRRDKAKAIDNFESIVFVETGGQVGRIKNEKKHLESLGYHTLIVYVGIEPDLDLNDVYEFESILDILVDRSKYRASKGGRDLDVAILGKSLDMMKKVKEKLLPEFGDDVLIINNNTKNLKKLIKETKSLINEWMVDKWLYHEDE